MCLVQDQKVYSRMMSSVTEDKIHLLPQSTQEGGARRSGGGGARRTERSMSRRVGGSYGYQLYSGEGADDVI